MHLQRVQVHDFRVLKNIDISFEKEFEPRIFPLGSLNGGGKSTLLQLIFVLLHCSSDPEKIPFLKNMLWNFKIDEGCERRDLATVEIWDGEKVVKLNFFAYRDSYIRELLSDSTTEDVTSKDYLIFSVFDKLEPTIAEISNLETRIKQRETIIEQLERISKIENDEELRSQLVKLINRYGRQLKSIGSQSLSEIWLEDLQKELQEALEEDKITLGELYAKSKRLEGALQQVEKYLKSQKLIYICSYLDSDSTDNEEVLLCFVETIDINQAEQFLKELSARIFLAAPATQVFLFLSQKDRKFLFKPNKNRNDYSSALQDSKHELQNFFTYDFLAVDILVDSFKNVRDQDFREAIETGEYGNNYKKLLHDLNSVLLNKRINLSSDFSGVTFKIDQDGKSVDIYP
ncbi:MAG: ATP-binding protein, partial [Cyanobacteria bacterium J06592_8]